MKKYISMFMVALAATLTFVGTININTYNTAANDADKMWL